MATSLGSDGDGKAVIGEDWFDQREIIRTVVQRIEIEPAKVAIVLRLPAEPSARGLEPIMVTLSRA